MKQVKFNLEIRKKNGEAINKNVPVRLSFHFNGKRLEYYTGVRVNNVNNFNKDYWKTGKPVIKANEPEAARKNQRLKEMRVKAELIYDSSIALGQQPSPTYIKSELDKQFKGKNEIREVILVKDGSNPLGDMMDEVLAYSAEFLFKDRMSANSVADGLVNLNWFKKSYMGNGSNYSHLAGREEQLTMNTPAATFIKYNSRDRASILVKNNANTLTGAMEKINAHDTRNGGVATYYYGHFLENRW